MESIAVPITLTFELGRARGVDIGSLERAVSAGLTEVGRRFWAAILAACEAAQMVSRDHVGCGGTMKANGRAPRCIVAPAGEVAIHRRRYRCLACAAELVPLDEALGLEPRMQHTLGVRERALWLVTELSYAKTAQALVELRGLAVSQGQLHRWHQRCVSLQGIVDDAHIPVLMSLVIEFTRELDRMSPLLFDDADRVRTSVTGIRWVGDEVDPLYLPPEVVRLADQADHLCPVRE